MRKISDILRSTREEKGLTLDEIERETKIKKEFLDAIEKGNFNSLPSESYAQGFVKNYAKHLGIPTSLALPLFRREYNAKHAVNIVPEFRRTQHKFNRRFLSAKTFLIGVAILVIGGYIFIQYSSLIFAPSLVVMTPTNGQSLSTNVVSVTGKTDPYATVTIRGEDVYIDLQGKFQKSVYLFSGEEKIKVIAKNRFGKQSEKIVTVRVK